MKTYTSKLGSEITKMTSKETGVVSNHNCDAYYQIKVLMEAHNLSKEEATKIYKENLEWANS